MYRIGDTTLRRLVALKSHAAERLNVANDGHCIYFTWREDLSDIWMMDVQRAGPD